MILFRNDVLAKVTNEFVHLHDEFIEAMRVIVCQCKGVQHLLRLLFSSRFLTLVMGKPTSTRVFNEEAADVNDDGVVNAADVVQIANIILGN